jgi:pimeloyl-ACP methyl ester carboxylesterase
MDAFIFVHGKQGGPNYDQCSLGKLVNEFVQNGHLVSYQAYAWGYKNVFTDYAHSIIPQVLSEANKLKARGATKIHLVGFSLGANLSLYCVSKLPNIFTSLILLAPAHNIHLLDYQNFISRNYQLAKDLVANSRGNAIYHFIDFNVEKRISIPALPLHYISYIDQEGPCNMEKSILEISNPINVLMVSGTNDKTQKVSSYRIWKPLAKTTHSQLVQTIDTHDETCPLKYNLIQEWSRKC